MSYTLLAIALLAICQGRLSMPEGLDTDMAPNAPPVAVIRVQGEGREFVTGEPMLLIGSDSYDPDGDDISYSWVMPDGSIRIGERVVWTPRAEGVQSFQLEVRDKWGLKNATSRQVVVSMSPQQVSEGDIRGFLLWVLPLAGLMLLLILVIAIFRGRRTKRLENVLHDVGVIHKPQFDHGTGDRAQKRILDLEPVVTVVDRHRKETRRRDPRYIEAESQVRGLNEYHPPPHIAETPRPKERMVDTNKVNATLECPSCKKIFRERLDPSTLEKGSKKIKCPHCGTEGEI